MIYNLFAALEVPPVQHLVNWPDIFFKGEPYAFNKVSLLVVLSLIATFSLFVIAGRQSKKRLAPVGVQNVVESSIDFIENGIIRETMGVDGMKWLTFLTTLFFFIFFCNIFSIIPGLYMPATARIALPMFLAIVVWFCFNIAGVVAQGPVHYFKSAVFPPGVPMALMPLVALIEFVSTFLVRPFSLAVRLFANTLAGHILLATFIAFCAAFIHASMAWAKPFALLPFAMLVFLTAFELLVAFLQAYIFTILTAVYIGGAVHPDH